ncbi:MAG: sigma-54-dependent Fis family transcriptional regulator [Bacteroidia bacterium]|nr:sigma-54-dependent Fis family transcriptional regulator [Bacteroidia bacterium]
MAKILIIDDEKSIRNTLKEILEYEKYEVDEAKDGAEGVKLIEKNKYDLVFCDIKMPKMDGLEVLSKVHEKSPHTPMVMISGHGTIDTAVESIKNGAFDFIPKPLDLNRILITLRNALEKVDLVQETKVLKKKLSRTTDMIGESEGLQKVRALIQKIAPTDARVMITGENGTGKELIARLIHENSDRASGPLIEVNCAAIPSELIESELFGHEKGSFTSAVKQRIGKFEQAHKGTLFLDEIGDMSLSAQAKVLRVLQEHKISRVGGDKEIKVDVRVLAATNKNIREEIDAKNFREDLFHRLSVIEIHLPTLSERTEDIPLLCNHFLKEYCEFYNLHAKSFSPKAIKVLQKLPWTGNIRELRNVVERLVILCEAPVIDDKAITTHTGMNAQVSA